MYEVSDMSRVVAQDFADRGRSRGTWMRGLPLWCPSLENSSSVLQEVGRGLAKTSSARQSGLVTALRGAVTATSRGRL